jgi:KDO2-lipid IV(A) lauroyltransferase
MTTAAPAPTLRQRARYGLLVAALWVLCRLPERPLLVAADALGGLWYRVGGRRREQARRNLARVTRWMAERGVGSARGQAAGRDARALDRLVRDAFRHSVRYNLILARGPTFDATYVDRWVAMDTPDELGDALADPAGAVFVGLHMGSMELPALFLARRTGRLATAPTETLADPLLQAHLIRTRRRMGIALVDQVSARREMVAAIRRGDPVGVVGDRDFSGGGIEVPLFGAPARLPIGPALVALETGAVPHVFGVHRDEGGVYHVSAERVPLPVEGTRRERVTAWLAAEARAFEHHVVRAPEQWFAVFFPIWLEEMA